ncbi:DUF3261 domain-containing protein [Aliamphritea ceti]|uniref:DUF3261 domain-containing protein n=1 Tax=Aliamphritea ceti TaxID=1524258 RepID=UPI0021C3E92B|nr:DUF3261 domain-containing protein [Aliamphritea ceti]
MIDRNTGFVAVRTLSTLVVAICLLLSGCSSFNDRAADSGYQPELLLLSPQDSPFTGVLKQKVTLSFHDIERSFLVVTRLNSEKIVLVVLLPTGQQLFQLIYDGQKLQHKASVVADIPTRELLAIMQFSLWPKASVKQAYSMADEWKLGWSEKVRVLSLRQELWLSVVFESNQIHIDNLLENYQVKIETLEAQ